MASVFATPLTQSTHSEVLEWRFPGKYQQFVLTGKSRAAWQVAHRLVFDTCSKHPNTDTRHTSFIIPQLNLLLDAGLCVNKQRPKHIFITHGHTDHCLLTPAFIKRSDPPDIYCPVEVAKVLNDFLRAKTVLNAGGLKAADDTDKSDAESIDEFEPSDEDPQPPAAPAAPMPPSERHWLDTHDLHGVQHGDVVPLRRTVDWTAEAFACDHQVPCVGYVFKMNSKKLKKEYMGRKGAELKELRESGVEITASHATPVFAFLGDTTAATLVAEPQWLKDEIPVVITECSFLYEEHRAQAVKTKHTIWADLEPVVRKWPKTTFVLMHFSLRYSDTDIRRYFANMQDPPPNIVIWVDGHPESGE